ncbi:MAG: transglutaminase domain-containing protein [Planctomycetota bacterium]|nr:MAG: transglutaminase domain-containing protein [Planctomycetota bacterium]REK30632.1 MAG: transglutaminase domain-containing protein [Planctomycetota bacterium]REK33006.1 MAG: transglutaminase domain-containing protein [Planctomycetota bacterium]
MRLEISATRSRLLQDGVVALALLAGAGFCVADADGNRSTLVVSLVIALQSAVTIAGNLYFRRIKKHFKEVPALSPLLLAVMVGSYLWEPFARWALGSGRPFETLVIFSLKNVMLAMAAAACWGRYGVWALFSSLFVALFSAAATSSPTVQTLTALYAAGGVVWLTIAYWEMLRGRLIASDRHRTFSRHWIAGGVLAAILLLAAGGLGENSVASSIQGWLPSSGGTGEHDPFSRNGVGDGEAVVAGTENITSFAPIDDAPFLQDDKPSLYDVFDEMYEEAVPPTNQDRAVALPPEMASRIKEHLHTRTEKASREFSTLRQSTERGRKVDDIHSDALFYVAGRTPLHLRLEVYDVFDGVTWYPTPDEEYQPMIAMTSRGGRNWADVRKFSEALECFQGPESHAIKVVNLDTNRIPAPLHLTGVHIGDVNRADMFGWAQDGVVRMQRDRLPTLAPIHLSSSVLDRTLLEESSLSNGLSRDTYRSLITSDDMTRIERLAEAWVEGVPSGWPQVAEIERRLRETYQLDPHAVASDEETLPVAQFLFEDRRGPDYQFATAAAVMLRSLGYPTRVVSGFYADPQKYDRRSRHTAVQKDDVHFWVEVYLGVTTWATIEPTPGYEVLAPPPGVLGRVLNAIVALGGWIAANAVWVIVGTLLAVGLYVRRFDLLEFALTLRWRLASSADPRRLALATWGLVEWRLNTCGWRRPDGWTARKWLLAEESADLPATTGMRELAGLVDWAAFAPVDSPSLSERDVVPLCRRVVRESSRKNLRRAEGRPGAWTRLVSLRRRLPGSAIPNPAHS